MWIATSENVPSHVYVQRRLKSACASAQCDQSLRCPHEENCILGCLKCVNGHSDQNARTRSITKTRPLKYIEDLTTKNWKFSDKKFDIFHMSPQNIDGFSLEPPRQGGYNEYPQYMFLSRNKKNNVYPCKPQCYYIKVGFQGFKII